MSKVLVTETYLEDIGDAIRDKLEVSTQYKPSQMANAIESIEGYPEPTGTKSITANGTGINVKDYASADVNVPNSYSASDEGKVVSNGELVSQTGTTVTQNGTYDTTENDEVVVNVSGGGGGSNDNFKIAMGAMSGRVYDTEITSLRNYAFYLDNAITGVEMTLVLSIGSNAFHYCSALASVSFPVCTSIGSYAFQSCSALTTASFPVCTSIGNSAFQSCSALASVYLLNSVVASVKGSTAFGHTPIANSSYLGYYGSIYVPSSLVDAYKSATNWSYYSDRITAYIE